MRLVSFHKQLWSFRSVFMLPGFLPFTFIVIYSVCFQLNNFYLLASLLICFLRFAAFILYYRSLLVELFSEE